MAIVKFYQTTSTKFNTASKDENALYFLTDTKQIYKGSVLYAEDFTGDISYISGIVGGNVEAIEFLSGTLTGFDTTTTVSSVIESIRTSAIQLSGSNVISVTGEGSSKGIDLTLASNKILAKTDTGLSAAVSLAKLGTANEGYAASYKLVGIDGTQLGDTINIPKDQFLKDAEFISSALADDVTASNNTVTLGKPCIKFTFEIKVKDDATGAETSTDKFVYVDVKNLVDTYTAGTGITLTSNEFSITKNGNNDDQFLVIGADGIGLSGITAAITEAVETEGTLRISADAFLSGQIDTLASSTDVADGDKFLSGAIVDGDQFLSGKVGDANSGISYISGIVGDNNTASENADKFLSGQIDTLTSSTDVADGDAFLSGKIDNANSGISYISGVVGTNKTESESADAFLSAQVDTNVTDITNLKSADGFLSATLVGFDTTTTVSSVIESIRTSAISVTGVNGVSVTGDGTAKTVSAVVKSTDKVLGVDADGLFTSVSLVKLGTATEGYAASYKLVGKDGSTALGDTINIPKDQFLTDAEFIPSASAADATASGSEVEEGDPCIKFTFAVKDESGAETTVAKVVYVNVKDLVDTYTAGSGLTLTGNDFNITYNGNNDDQFLVIGVDGIGLSGITTAITTAVSSEATLRESADAFISGQINTNNTDITNLKAADAFISGQIAPIASAASGNVATNYIGGTYGSGTTVAEDIASIKGAMISGTTTDTLKHVALINATANEVTYSTANIGGNEITLSGSGDIQDQIWDSGTSALSGDTVNNTALLATEEAVVKYVKDMLTWKELS